jgi:hypothetical protein
MFLGGFPEQVSSEKQRIGGGLSQHLLIAHGNMYKIVWYVIPIFIHYIPPIPLQADGTASPCVATELLEALPDGDERPEQEQIAKNCAGVAYVGACVRIFCRFA